MSERELPSYFANAIEDEVVRPALLYEGEFLTVGGVVAFLRLWTGLGTLNWDGKSWIGGGKLLGVTALEEAAEIKAVGFAVSLSGQDPANISLALSTSQLSQGRSGKIWLALFDEAGQMLTEPLLLKRGKLDVAFTEDTGAEALIAVQYEDRLINLQKASDRRYTDQDQRRDYPDDRGFEFQAALQDMEILWGPGGR